jgi:hypothetical protein
MNVTYEELVSNKLRFINDLRNTNCVVNKEL